MRERWSRRGRGWRRAALTDAQRELAESNDRYRSLFEYNPHATFSLDLDGTFRAANDVAQKLSGYSFEQLQTMDFSQVIVPEHVPRTLEAFAGALQRVPQQLRADMCTRSGIVLELNIAAVPIVVGGEVVGVHGVAEDMTRENRLLRDLEAMRRAAEEANATKSLFLANMSHEVRTPLTSVLGAAEMLAETTLDDEQSYLLHVVERSGERLLRLVNDILDVSRLEAGRLRVEPAPFALRCVLDEVNEWAGPLAVREGLGWSCDLDPALPAKLVGDSDRVAQVLTNLVGNAFKFTERGAVALRVEDVTQEPGPPVPGAVRGDTLVRFSVTDTGIGMAEDQLDTLFDSFTQGDDSATRRYGGAGLGLAICRELVALMGGTIEASSEAERGSCVRFTLPLPPLPDDA